MTATVYKCKEPLVLDSYGIARKVELDEFNARCDEFKASLGGKDLHGISYFDGGWAIQGYTMEQYGDEPLPGWRRERNSLQAVPAKRTPEGKAIAQELNKLYLKGNKYPGVPESVSCEGFRIWPRAERLLEGWWLTFSKEPYPEELDRIDAELWRPARLSEYYAMKEAEEGAK